VLIDDPEFARAMEGQFRRDLDRSLEVERRLRRAPRHLQRVLPSGLHRRPSGGMAIPRQRRASRELRGRAAVLARTVISAARRSVYGPISAGLVLLGLLFLVLPRPMAYVFGVICVWFAIAAGFEAFKRRSEQ
ncbi:MAG TPA: hypothetical protein VFK09_07055, partial [Gemmatimonadales bacterium]|nr:hypothetical protein [Gemmatimonadales bacterium]